MSQKNKFRFLISLLFSSLAHSSVLVASLFLTHQISEDPQGATLKAAADSILGDQSAQARASKQTLHTVDLVDIKSSTAAIPDSTQVASLAQTLPEKTSGQKEILLARQDDPTAVEIKKPIVTKDEVAEQPALTPEPKVKPKAEKKVEKKTEKKIAKIKPTPKKEKPKKETKVAKLDKPKTPKKLEEPKVEKVKEEQQDVVVAENAELVPVKEQVDAEAKEPNKEVEEETPAPVVKTEPQLATQPAREEAIAPAPARIQKQKQVQAEPAKDEQAAAPVVIASKQGSAASSNENAQAGATGQGSSKNSTNAAGTSGSEDGISAGGSPAGIRDGDSLAELAGNIRPTYPLEDRRARREGIAIFVAKVTADGRVKDIRLESSATPSMNSAAVKAFANYHYKTGQEGWIRKKFVFKLNGEAEEATGLRRTSQNNATSW